MLTASYHRFNLPLLKILCVLFVYIIFNRQLCCPPKWWFGCCNLRRVRRPFESGCKNRIVELIKMWWDFLFWASPLPNSYFLLAFQNDTLFWLYQLSIQTHTVFIIRISPTCIYRVNNLEDVDHFCLYVSTVRGWSCCVPLITDCALHWAHNAQIWN